MKKSAAFILCSILSMILFATSASAHVVVYPQESTQGVYEKFAVRVPSEKEGTSTVKVELSIPDGVNISRVEPKPDWEYSLTRDDSDKIVRISWETTGDGLDLTEFTEFNIQGKIDDQATALVWKAYQTYADGSVVEWTGAEGSDLPASVTSVSDGEANDDATSGANLPLYLSIAALVLSLFAIIVAFMRKR